jgi:hypothetical protein
MGYWGLRIFENDFAMDWVVDLYDTSDTSLLYDSLSHAAYAESADEIEADKGAEALAASEVIAAALTAPCGDLPADVRAWLKRHHIQISTELLLLAIRAVQRIETESHVTKYWTNQVDVRNWHEIVRELRNRLENKLM